MSIIMYKAIVLMFKKLLLLGAFETYIKYISHLRQPAAFAERDIQLILVQIIKCLISKISTTIEMVFLDFLAFFLKCQWERKINEIVQKKISFRIIIYHLCKCQLCPRSLNYPAFSLHFSTKFHLNGITFPLGGSRGWLWVIFGAIHPRRGLSRFIWWFLV